MLPPCSRCESQRIINLETARKLGIAAGTLAGIIKGAGMALYRHGSNGLALSTARRFPLNRLSAALIGGTSGGATGAIAGYRFFAHLMPPGTGIPFLCQACGHAFRYVLT